jgi:hypothetical protein
MIPYLFSKFFIVFFLAEKIWPISGIRLCQPRLPASQPTSHELRHIHQDPFAIGNRSTLGLSRPVIKNCRFAPNLIYIDPGGLIFMAFGAFIRIDGI